MKKSLLVLIMALFFSGCSVIENSSQVIVVQSKNWDTKYATLKRFEKIDDSWVKVGDELHVIIGRNGMGWGLGLHQIPKDAKIIKQEGDGKSPAGIFRLTSSYGYEDNASSFNYLKVDKDTHCVDDSDSVYYNKIVHTSKIKKDYLSHEVMKRNDDLYKYGITVEHNKDAIKGAGSCIFMHIKRDEDSATAGCTAMYENQIKEILDWLKVDKNPLLIQFPKNAKELLHVEDILIKKMVK